MLERNEAEVNLILLRIHRWVFLIFPITLLCNWVNLLQIPWGFALMICAIGIPVCSIPILYQAFGFSGSVDELLELFRHISDHIRTVEQKASLLKDNQ